MTETKDFDLAMRQIYLDAKEAGYNATYFLRMLNEIGGVATAKELIMSEQPSDGFTKLWEMRLLDISVEALVLRPEWRELFTPEERRAARQRLEEYGWRGG